MIVISLCFDTGERRFIGGLVRAGRSSNFIENDACGSPATGAQAETGATIEFRCERPRMASLVSVDIDLSNPAVVHGRAMIMIAEVTVEVYAPEVCAGEPVLLVIVS